MARVGARKSLPCPRLTPGATPGCSAGSTTTRPLEVFKTDEVEQLTATLARGLTNEFLRELAAKELPELDATLGTDAGLDALRTLVAGVIVARNPSNGGDVVVDDEMLLSAMKRVFDVDLPLRQRRRAGDVVQAARHHPRFRAPHLAVRDQGPARWTPDAGSPELDDERQMLLELANAVMSSNVPAEKKVAQISAAIKAAAC